LPVLSGCSLFSRCLAMLSGCSKVTNTVQIGLQMGAEAQLVNPQPFSLIPQPQSPCLSDAHAQLRWPLQTRRHCTGSKLVVCQQHNMTQWPLCARIYNAGGNPVV
jgi:hypothetical protein